MRRRTAGGVGLEWRDNLAAELRALCAAAPELAREPGCPWSEQLARLEADEPVGVAGWQVGRATDFGRYWLHADGSLEPVEPEDAA